MKSGRLPPCPRCFIPDCHTQRHEITTGPWEWPHTGSVISQCTWSLSKHSMGTFFGIQICLSLLVYLPCVLCAAACWLCQPGKKWSHACLYCLLPSLIQKDSPTYFSLHPQTYQLEAERCFSLLSLLRGSVLVCGGSLQSYRIGLCQYYCLVFHSNTWASGFLKLKIRH